MIPEWNKAYFNHDLLKEVLNPFKRITNSMKQENLTVKLIREQIVDAKIPQEVQTKLQILDEEFVQLFQDEIKKCNQFYTLQINILSAQFEQAVDCENDLEIRKNLEILYKKGNYLKQFKLYNIQTIQSILKQYRHYTSFIDNSESHLAQQFNNLQFVNDKILNRILKNIKQLYIRKDWEEVELKRLIQKYAISHNLQYIGFLGGVILFLVFSFIYQRIDLNYLNISEDYSTYLLFITMGIPIIYLWLFSTLLQILKKKYINYWVVFKVDYIKDSIQKFYYLAAVITIFYLIIVNYGLIQENIEYANNNNLIYYSIFNLFEFDPIMTEFVLWILLVLFMLNPIKIFGYEARIYFWKLQFRTLIGTKYQKDVIWNIEQMISCCQFFKLFSYSIIYYIYLFQNKDVLEIAEFNLTSQIILTIPFVYGFYYSIRQFFDNRGTLINLIKFSLMLVLIVICQINIKLSYMNQILQQALIIIIGIIVAVIDIKYDWNLFNKQQKKKFLRPILGYHPYFYYFGIIYNIIGRILLFDQLCTIIQSKNRLLLLCIIEAFRLFIWNLISIEKEHVINLGEFKAVPEISGPENCELFNQLNSFLETLEQNEVREGSFRKKTTSLQIMINKLEQNAQQKQL